MNKDHQEKHPTIPQNFCILWHWHVNQFHSFVSYCVFFRQKSMDYDYYLSHEGCQMLIHAAKSRRVCSIIEAILSIDLLRVSLSITLETEWRNRYREIQIPQTNNEQHTNSSSNDTMHISNMYNQKQHHEKFYWSSLRSPQSEASDYVRPNHCWMWKLTVFFLFELSALFKLYNSRAVVTIAQDKSHHYLCQWLLLILTSPLVKQGTLRSLIAY